MQGLEIVIARLAGTVAGAAAKSLLVPRPGAGLVDAPLRPLPRPAGPDRLARVLGQRLSGAYAGLAEAERLAAADAVRDTFEAAGGIGPERLFAVDLAPARLAAELRAHRPAAGLGARGEELYEELLALCCAHLMEQLTAHPQFPARAAVEQARAAGRTRDLVDDVRERMGPRPTARALAFEQRYADFMAETHGRLELFGLTLGRSGSEWPLDTAYISLAVSGDDGPRTDELRPWASRGPVKAEQALADAGRVLLRGPAGSGKSTLVQWLALNAARRTFGRELDDWNRCVPFVLRLRSFAADGALPMPEDFLRAAGVPLHGSAPAGWAESLLAEGRALVLVDGVDEVPMRLRSRTEAWVRSLIAAFPHARYVVTTRPSAVPEDWLAGQGFTAHSLLPMDRHDIRAFVAHWHASARRASLTEAERELLDTYETSLSHAVTTRRDLGRLATNPLMCAVLCALNRDRRMQLPRARKELYDAALDMLLVRRDTEREITGVEGVTLTRDEQTALLQRLAYWLIRNGQAEASREDAAEMVGEWLTAMPQVDGDADQVFAHLLIRSGLLREPVPGAVGFVHRTFQDYLGAKAAVEARDLGVLVRSAHDDQWDDVVRMAVGHARPDERARLLRQLLRRADRTQRWRHRLVLLAAACLEHAPELDPAVRAQVQARTQELLPPRKLEEAAELAKVGELVLELLPGPEGLDEESAAAVVRTAGLIGGGDAAMEVISRFRADTRFQVAFEVSQHWGAFDTGPYADAVLSGATLPRTYLKVRTPEQVAALPGLRHLTWVRLEGGQGIPAEITGHTALQGLFFDKDPGLADLTPLGGLRQLETLGFDDCPLVTDLGPLRGLPLQRLYLFRLTAGLALAPLAGLTELRTLVLNVAPGAASVGNIPAGPALTHLTLLGEAGALRLDGLERWSGLTSLTVTGDDQGDQLARQSHVFPLELLQYIDHSGLDLGTVVRHQELGSLYLGNCRITSSLAPLRDLPRLTHLSLSDCGGPIDLTPLADLEHLTIHTYLNTTVHGASHFPPERLRLGGASTP